MKYSIFPAGIVLLAAALLTACGGGGGGGGGIPFFPVVGGNGGAVTLTGRATYDSVPPAANGGLNYAGTTRKPIRGAVVEVVSSSGAVLGSGMTDGDGNYSVSGLATGASVQLRVKAQLRQTGSGPSWDVTVRDNTEDDALYAVETPAFAVGGAGATRDVHAPSGWSGDRYSGPRDRTAAPFAILDTVYAAQAKVLSVAPSAVFPPLRLFWSPNNTGFRGDPRLGQIGTSHFEPDDLSIYILGKENADTDEYDSSVVAHEWGHYYQAVFSRDDSVGGSHDRDDRLDMRVAFSEGWGNGWSGIALGRNTYSDSSEAAQGRGFVLALDAGAPANPGWYSEFSIQYLFWRLNAQTGFGPIHDALASPAFKSGVPVTSIHAFAKVLRDRSPAAGGQLDPLLTSQSIRAGTDGFGTDETNNAGDPQVLPIYAAALVGGTANTACVSNGFDPDGEGNKLRSYAYLRFPIQSAGSYTIRVDNGGAGSLPGFTVFRGGVVASAGNGGSALAVSTVNLNAGEHVLAVQNFQNASACFRVTIQQ